MAETQCAYVNAETGNQCPRMIKSGLFCEVHNPANRGTVCYVQQDEQRLEAELEKADELHGAVLRRRRKPPPVA
jgi:hypothetical protein